MARCIWLLALCVVAASAQSDGDLSSEPRLTIYIDFDGSVDGGIDLPAAPADLDRLQAGLAAAIGCDEELIVVDRDGIWSAALWCGDPLPPDSLLLHAELQLESLRSALQLEAVETINFVVSHPRAPHFEMRPAIDGAHYEPGRASIALPIDELPARVEITVGYTRESIICRSVAPVAAILLFPLGAFLLGLAGTKSHSRLARNALRDLSSVGSFLAALTLWYICVDISGLADLPLFLAYLPGLYGVTLAVSLLGPPLVLSMLAALIANGFLLKLGASAESGTTVGLRLLCTHLRWIGPTVAFLGVPSGWFWGLWATLAWAAIGVVAFVVPTLYLRLQKRRNESSLTEGPLYRRVAQLAKQANVSVTQLRVVPAGLSRFADLDVRQHRAVLSENLPSILNDRQFAAFALYRLIYSKRNRSTSASVVWAVSTLLGHSGVSWFISETAPAWLPSVAFLATAVVNYAAVVFAFDRLAERGAAEHCSDPDALVSAEIRVWRFVCGEDVLPMSARREVDRIAARAGLSASRVETLLHEPLPSAETHPSEPEAAPRIFSDDYARRITKHLAWMTVIPTVAGPVGVVYYAAALGLADQSLWTLYGAAWVGLTFLVLAVGFVQPFSGLRGMGRKLKQRLQAEGLPTFGPHVAVVGLGPHAEQRSYSGMTFWDAGLLFLGRDGIAYVGEQARFRPSRGQVDFVSAAGEGKNFAAGAAVQVRWRDSNRNSNGVFRLTGLSGKLFRPQLPRCLALWNRNESLDELPATLRDLAPPGLPDVAGTSMDAAYSLGSLVQGSVTVGILAGTSAFLTGLPLHVATGAAAAWHAVLISIAVLAAAEIAALAGRSKL